MNVPFRFDNRITSQTIDYLYFDYRFVISMHRSFSALLRVILHTLFKKYNLFLTFTDSSFDSEFLRFIFTV